MGGEYLHRVLDDELDRLLPHLPAIAIEGARGVGKTQTARRRARTTYLLDDPLTHEALAADPRRILSDPGPVLIDEWQLLPTTWDVVRRAVDDGAPPGTFLLTGSAEHKDERLHTGAGRIVDLRMRSMTLAERGFDRATVSLAGLLEGATPPVAGETARTVQDYVEAIVATGLPGLQGLPPEVLSIQLDGYVRRIADRDLPALGVGSRSRDRLLAWTHAYANAIASTASYERIRDASTPGETTKPSRITTASYLAALESLWVIEPIAAWHPTNAALRRFALSPKHQLFDPGVAAHLAEQTSESILGGSPAGPARDRQGTIMGALFEAQTAHDVAVYAQASGARLRHFRDAGGRHEIDLIVQRRDGRVLAMEVKLSRAPSGDDKRHLLWLKDAIGDELLDMVIVYSGPIAFRDRDGIAMVPLALLGA